MIYALNLTRRPRHVRRLPSLNGRPCGLSPLHTDYNSPRSHSPDPAIAETRIRTSSLPTRPSPVQRQFSPLASFQSTLANVCKSAVFAPDARCRRGGVHLGSLPRSASPRNAEGRWAWLAIVAAWTGRQDVPCSDGCALEPGRRFGWCWLPTRSGRR